MDFWKGMVHICSSYGIHCVTNIFYRYQTLAQALIFSAYLLYGCFVYVTTSTLLNQAYTDIFRMEQAFQGQFTQVLAYQGVSKHAWQNVGNILSLITGIIAAGLYGNIGISE